VLDVQQRPVVGQLNPNAKTQRRPIAVDGVTVGWLVFEDAPPWFDAADIRFRDEQLRAAWIIGGLVMLLASLVAIVLARRLLAPVKRLASATHRLASGEYATRVAPASPDELGQLVDDFNRLARTLESNESLRRNFMADVSHELRTPLAVLKGELEALQDDIRQFTPDSLKSLQAEVTMLSKLIDDLYELALADVGALVYRYEDVNIAALLKDSLRGFAERFAGRQLTLEAKVPDAPVMVGADPQRLKQLFNNLLENCVRYTDAGGRVQVSLRRDRDAVRIDVEDSAPGVPATLLPRLFERLFRVEASRNRERGGAGLGLAIVKSVVEAHRGTIVAKPSHLGGLWIQVVLPLAAGGSAP
jgi:two-component system sensor histidine kinase BaeS